MAIRKVTFEVDNMKLFDRLKKVSEMGESSMDSLGSSLIASLLTGPGERDLMIFDLYGVRILDLPVDQTTSDS